MNINETVAALATAWHQALSARLAEEQANAARAEELVAHWTEKTREEAALRKAITAHVAGARFADGVETPLQALIEADLAKLGEAEAHLANARATLKNNQQAVKRVSAALAQAELLLVPRAEEIILHVAA